MPISRIKTDGIQDDAITSAKIGDTNVATADIANSSVTTAKIADDAVTGAKIENNPTIAGNATVAGDLTVDTSTLKVDSSNNRVGVGTASPTSDLHVSGGAGAHVAIQSSAGSHWRLGDAVGSSNGIFVVRDHTNSANRIQILADGKTQIAQGVTFGSDTAAANTLDDYEEGTWTPALSSHAGTHTLIAVAGRYQKIGVFCTARFFINWSGFNGNGSYGIQVTGLPFTSGTQIVGSRDIGQIFGSGHENVPVLNSSFHVLGGYLTQSAATATFRMSGGGQGERSLNGGISTGGGYMYGEVRYTTA